MSKAEGNLKDAQDNIIALKEEMQIAMCGKRNKVQEQ